jgi:hypothetical protein
MMNEQPETIIPHRTDRPWLALRYGRLRRPPLRANHEPNPCTNTCQAATWVLDSSATLAELGAKLAGGAL